MEVSEARFGQLRATYQQDPFVHCYNVSSVPLRDFATVAAYGWWNESVSLVISSTCGKRLQCT